MSAIKPIIRELKQAALKGFAHADHKLHQLTANMDGHLDDVIRQVRDARGPVKVRVTVPTTNGWKAIALSAGARQELFISTALSKEDLEKKLDQLCREQ